MTAWPKLPDRAPGIGRASGDEGPAQCSSRSPEAPRRIDRPLEWMDQQKGTTRRGSRTTSPALPDASHQQWKGSKPFAPERVSVDGPPDEAELAAAGLISRTTDFSTVGSHSRNAMISVGGIAVYDSFFVHQDLRSSRHDHMCRELEPLSVGFNIGDRTPCFGRANC